MYSDIFSFNLNNTSSNMVLLFMLSLLAQKYSGSNNLSLSMNMSLNMMVMMMYSLMIAMMPGSLFMQGGVNIWFILLSGLMFTFLSNWSSFKHYKLIPSSPMLMMPIIIGIEIISYLMRPLSLMLRILINLTIGHIVMYMLYFPLSMFYNLVEMFMYSIQIYIFWTLVSIYSK